MARYTAESFTGAVRTIFDDPSITPGQALALKTHLQGPDHWSYGETVQFLDGFTQSAVALSQAAGILGSMGTPAMEIGSPAFHPAGLGGLLNVGGDPSGSLRRITEEMAFDNLDRTG